MYTCSSLFFVFFFNDTATTEIYTLSLHDALPIFAAFSFLLALIGVVTFWPPKSPAIVAWVLVWGTTCVATGIAILRRMRYAPALVWTLLTVAGLSALDALRSGLLGGIGILIDIVLFVPLIWFAVWY